MNPQDRPEAGSTTDQQRIADLEARVVELEHRLDSLLEWTSAVVGPDAAKRYRVIRPKRFHPPVKLPGQTHPFRENT